MHAATVRADRKGELRETRSNDDSHSRGLIMVRGKLKISISKTSILLQGGAPYEKDIHLHMQALLCMLIYGVLFLHIA
jgi:hypothetical protein